MKKLLCGIFAIILIFSIFAACGETENPTTTTTTQANTTTTTTNPTTTIELVDLNNYVGYWYHCLIMDRNNLDEQFFVDVNQLHIKSVENNVITLDYTLTTLIDEKDIVAEVKGNICEFQADGCSVKIKFTKDDYGDYCVDVFVLDENLDVVQMMELDFSPDKPVEAEFKVTPADNYDFKDYLGYWYIEEPELPNGPYLYNGLDEIHIKNVEGNVVTFDYELYYQGPVWDNDIVVEINNNVGLFKGKQSFGVLRFTGDSVVIDAHTLYGGGTIIDEMAFDYQTSTDWNKKLEEYAIQNGYA